MTAPDLWGQPDTLSPSRRAKRGFTRIGFALGAATLVGGLTIAAIFAPDAARTEQRRYEGVICLQDAWRQGKLFTSTYNEKAVDVDKSGCPLAFYTYLEELRAAADKPSYIGVIAVTAAQVLGITALLVLIAFAVPWAIGWILAGFLRD